MTEDQREIRRKKRVLEYAEKIGNINVACRRFGIARSTFYLWRDLYREGGEAGLARRMRCDHNYPNKTPDEVIGKILHLRRTYPMGPIRIVSYLQPVPRHKDLGYHCLPGVQEARAESPPESRRCPETKTRGC